MSSSRPASPLLSVIVPAIAADLELRRCIDSVRLALPDAGEREIVLVLPARHVPAAADAFPDAVVVPETRASVYGAMNDGVAASRGKYLYFLGKDDILLPAASDVMQLLREAAPRVVFTDVYWGADGLRRGRTSRVRVLFRNVCQQGIVYSRAAVVASGPYLRQLRVQADHLLNVRILWDGSAHGAVRYLPVPLAWYAATGLSHRARDVNFYKVHAALIGRYLGPVAACLWRSYKKLRPDRVPPA